MPISGLVLSFRGDVSGYPEALRQLTAESAIEIGERQGAKLAVVVDTDSPAQDRAIWSWVHALPGVERVDVAFVGFDEPAAPAAGPSAGGRHS